MEDHADRNKIACTKCGREKKNKNEECICEKQSEDKNENTNQSKRENLYS